jgi:cyclic pyranopterin monophosphate synthase
MSELSHLEGDGRVRMVDVGDKPETTRVAIARGKLITTREVLKLVSADGLPKADVLATARIAGILAAKKTSELIPLCHQVPLSSVTVVFELGDDAIAIEAIAKTRNQTGVEMEALTAVAIAGLTLHDMIKAVDPGAVLTDIALAFKSGGKRGNWSSQTNLREHDTADEHQPGHEHDIGHAHAHAHETEHAHGTASTDASQHHAVGSRRTGIVIVASTRGARGERVDTTGPVIVEWLRARGFDTGNARVVADADITDALSSAAREQPSVILTTGGTGVSPTDATPEATAAVLERELIGVAETLRRRGEASTPTAAISRGRAGTVGRTVIVNLPGSAGGVHDGLAVLTDLLEHLVDQVSGSARHDD